MTQAENREQILEPKLANLCQQLPEFLVSENWEKSINICQQLIIICAEKLLVNNPPTKSMENYILLGDYLAEKGNLNAGEKSAQDFREQLGIYYEQLGRKYLEEKDYLSALRFLNKSQEKGRKTAELYGNLGTVSVNLQKLEQAINYYQEALKLNPKLSVVYRNLARLFSQIGQEKEASEYWYQAFLLDNELNTAAEYYQLGNKFFKENEREKAMFSCRKATELNPNHILAYDLLGQILVKQNQKKEAVETYQKLGLILFKKKKYKQAIESYTRAIQLSKTLGHIDQRLINLYKKAIENYADSSANNYFELGKLLRSKGKFDEAIDAFLKTLELEPNLKEVYVALQYTPISNKKLDLLINSYQELVKKEPEIAIIWQNLGDVLTEKGNLKEAINCYQNSCYQQAITIHPELKNINWKSQKEQGPDFLIIGTAKGGTSSLYRYISSHPQALLPHRKEIAFFSQGYHYGAEWYLSHFPTITDNPEYITGEATPAYLRFTGAESRVYNLFPDVKLIVLLRNPVEQLISWHYHKVNTGVYQKTLEQAIADELKPIDKLSEEKIMQILVHQKYNLMGCLYYYHLKRWMNYFPREQFLILKSEDFFENTPKMVQEVYQFLGLTEYQLEKYPKLNVGYYPNISEEIRQFIADYCRPHNRKLEEYLGMEFNWD